MRPRNGMGEWRKMGNYLAQDTIIKLHMKGVGGGFVFFEDAEKAGAAAGEGGIEGAVGVEGIFYGLEFGMELEDGGFEIVDEGFGPVGGRGFYEVCEWGGVFRGGGKGESPGGADVDAGVDEGEGIAGEVEFDRLEVFAAAGAEAGGIVDKKGAVAAEFCGVPEELLGGEAEVELGIERF